MRKVLAVLVAVLVLAAGSAEARPPVPMEEIENVPVATVSGKTIQASQVKEAIIAAAKSKNWNVSQAPAGGKLIATLNVRSKHTIVVAIEYDATKYSIRYQSSDNMHAGTDETGRRIIAPQYNTWTKQLSVAIQRELNKL